MIYVLSLSWKADKYPKFWNKTLEFGYKHRLGTKLTPIRQTPLDVEDKLDIKSYDFRQVNEIAKRRKVRDQGNCGASWAFSTIGNIHIINAQSEKKI